MGVNKLMYYGRTVFDISDSTVTPQNLLAGTVAYNAAGDRIVGTYYPPQTFTVSPSVTWNYKDGSKINTDGSYWNLGRTSGGADIYYAIAEFDLASVLAGRTIRSVKFYVKCSGGNSTNCPAGAVISKSDTLASCEAAGQNPTGTNTLNRNDTTNYLEFDLTGDADVLQQAGVSYVLLSQVGTTNSTYKTMYTYTAAASNAPYMVIETGGA